MRSVTGTSSQGNMNKRAKGQGLGPFHRPFLCQILISFKTLRSSPNSPKWLPYRPSLFPFSWQLPSPTSLMMVVSTTTLSLPAVISLTVSTREYPTNGIPT
ncbi:hypothetical protein HGRIS_001131 [Hohenbuehelia grisea]|uniref:Uncharacterized protein n=1 Tax=Hohenbuehelia grisea TaxID=104357 RepID=A0ABR3JPV7_9AGAR